MRTPTTDPFLFPEFDGPRQVTYNKQREETDWEGCRQASFARNSAKKKKGKLENGLPLVRLKKDHGELEKEEDSRRKRGSNNIPMLRLRRMDEAVLGAFNRVAKASMPMVRLRREEEDRGNHRAERSSLPVVRLKRASEENQQSQQSSSAGSAKGGRSLRNIRMVRLKRSSGEEEELGYRTESEEESSQEEDGEVTAMIRASRASMPIMRLRRDHNAGPGEIRRVLRSTIPMIRLRKSNKMGGTFARISRSAMPMVRLRRGQKVLWPSLPVSALLTHAYEWDRQGLLEREDGGGQGDKQGRVGTFDRVSRHPMPMVRLRRALVGDWAHVIGNSVGGEKVQEANEIPVSNLEDALEDWKSQEEEEEGDERIMVRPAAIP